MADFNYLPLDRDQPLPGKDFEEQTTAFLEQAARTAVWNQIVGKPGAASPGADGLMSSEDKERLDSAVALAARLGAMHPEFQGAIPTWVPAPCGYRRSVTRWQSSRAHLFPPAWLAVVVGDTEFRCEGHPPISINQPENWDDASLANPAVRRGRDLFIHAVSAGGCSIRLSSRKDTIAGVDASVLLGGFHCLCADAGDIDSHPLSGLAAGDILPLSLWDLWHRPQSLPTGMVFVPALEIWSDVYLPATDGTATFGTLPAVMDEVSAIAAFRRQGKYLLPEAALQSVLAGTGMEPPGLPHTSGDNRDESGRRLVSNFGLEDIGKHRGFAPPIWMNQ